jgi:Innexin
MLYLKNWTSSLLTSKYSWIVVDVISQECHRFAYNLFADMINTYCWIRSTHTLSVKDVSTDFINPVYTGAVPLSMLDENKAPRYQSYYQWVCVFLLFQVLDWRFLRNIHYHITCLTKRTITFKNYISVTFCY